MNIHFHTNLDLARELLPFDMGHNWDHVPAVGSYIEIPMPTQDRQILALQVTSVRYFVDGNARVELHIPSYDKRSIAEWETWMRKRLGRV